MDKQRLLRIEDCAKRLEEIQKSIGAINEAESATYEKLPDSLMYGEKGERMEKVMDSLDDCQVYIDDSLDALNEIFEIVSPEPDSDEQ